MMHNYTNQEKFTVSLVLVCHFVASFTALGIPLFLPKLVEGMIHIDQMMYLGWLYILPTICTAIATPWWGRFADQYGKKLSLTRAQLGLALGFIIAGNAPNIWVFALALVIQGACGGTFAASNSYLANQVTKSNLSKTLNLTQFSARLSLVVAPIVIGFVITSDKPLAIYNYLALLPLCAAFISMLLPSDHRTEKLGAQITTNVKPQPVKLSFNQILWIKFFFSFATVVTFPYFLPYMQSLGVNQTSLTGFYFSLPHLVYLLMVVVSPTCFERLSANTLIHWGLFCLACSALIHYMQTTQSLAIPARVIMGMGICLTFWGLHRSVASLKIAKAGLMFGRFDSASKWAGVVAGVISGITVQHFNIAAPFILSLLAAVCALIVMFVSFVKLKVKETTHA